MPLCRDCQDAFATSLYAQSDDVALLTGVRMLDVCAECWQTRTDHPDWICAGCGSVDGACPKGQDYCRSCVERAMAEQDYLDEQRSLRHLTDEEKERI